MDKKHLKKGMKQGAKKGDNKIKLLQFLKVNRPEIYNEIVKPNTKTDRTSI